MKTFNHFICLFILFLGFSTFGESRSFDLPKEGILADILKDCPILLDSFCVMTIEDIDQLSDLSFDYDPADFRYQKDKCLWIKLNLKSSFKDDADWMMTVFNQPAAMITVYQKSENDTWGVVDSIGTHVPFYDRNVISRFPAFKLKIKEGNNQFLIRYYSESYYGLNSIIQPVEMYINYSNPYYFVIGGFYFVLFILILYNTLFYISTRDKIYLLYIVFVFAAALDRMEVDQIGFALFWPDWPELNAIIYRYSRSLFLLALVAYSSYFLSINKIYPRVSNIIKGLVIVYVVHWMMPLIWSSYPGGLLTTTVLIFALLLCIAYVTVRELIRGNKPVRTFAVGFTSMFIAIVASYLFYNRVIDGNHFVYFVLFYSISIDALMFSFALSARLKQERIQKEDALQRENEAKAQVIVKMEENEKLLNKVNEELEDKVQERTEELSEANQRLKEQSEIIQKYNAELDKQNWELNREIKEVSVQRVFHKTQTFEELLKVFPGKSECYQLVSGLKWGDDFKCRKCESDSFSKGPEYLSRRCTKCGTIESVTANTIFHKLRFPIEKAFYIAHVETSGRDVTTTRLSEELDLNPKSCARFRTKVGEAVKMRNGMGEEVRSWEDVVIDK